MSWLWAIVAVLGWYSVGTQMKRGGAELALKGMSKILYGGNSLGRPAVPRGDPEPEAAAGIPGAIELATPPRPSLSETILASPSPPLSQRQATGPVSKDRILGLTVRGDEEAIGPIFIYSRIFSWTFTAQLIMDTWPDTQEKSYTPPRVSTGSTSAFSWNKWSDISNAWYRMITAFALAVLFHALTTMMSFMSVYLSRTMGRKCLSYAYASYFCASTLSAALLVFSSILSTIWSRRKALHAQSIQGLSLLIAVSAVITRVVGKAIAVISALGFLVHCFFQFYGVYNSCYCSTIGSVNGSEAFITFSLQPRPEIRMTGIRSTLGSWLPLLISLVAVVAYSGFIIMVARRKSVVAGLSVLV
jgi:hypothetical protein